MNTGGLFVTGTDTGVGKTYVASLIARELVAAGLKVGAYKPVCSGSDDRGVWRDVESLSAAIGDNFPLERICPQRFTAPLAPPVAARREGLHVDSHLLRTGARWWQDRVELLLVEGVGGLLCPLTDEETVADLASDLGFPLVVVAHMALGTINHTLMTIEVAKHRGLRVARIVLNQASADAGDLASNTNAGEIAARVDVPLLGVVAHGQSVGLLQQGRLIRINWLTLSQS